MSNSQKIHSYKTGADMWLDCCKNHGETSAKRICNRYLKLQLMSTREEEIRFCKELYATMLK